MNFSKLLPVVFILLFVGILGLGYVYFFIVSPTFIEKPTIEKPTILENEPISEEQLFYVMNEINAYKLHNDPFTNEPPIIEFVIEDESTLIGVEDNDYISLDSGEPDLKIYLDEKDLFELLQEDNFEETILEKYNNDEIDIKIIADEATLALKGYKSIYDKIASSSNELTGNIVKLNPEEFTNGLNISVLFFMAIIMSLILKKV